jgi:thiol-disulfide isomerase/thioredoxin
MKQIILLILLTITILSGCTTDPKSTIQNIDSSSTLEDFYGKPSVIIFAGTYCGHCVSSMPVLKKEVYDVYKEDINFWVNVIDKKTFLELIPQGYNPNLDFENITNSDCGYVPSWVVLDKFGKVALKSCGNEKEIKDIVSTINNLLN